MDIKQPFIITISRELGSGGRTVGRKLAETLGVRYSDKELIEALRNEFHLTTDAIEKLKGEKKNWFAKFLQRVAPMPKSGQVVEWDESILREYNPDVTSEDIYAAEAQILQAIAQEGSCVIAGRSAFYLLKDCPNKLDIFITASREKRIERVIAKQKLSAQDAAETIDRIDQYRENYIQRIAGVSRYDIRNYDCVINMDQLADEDAAVALILQIIGKQ